MIQQTSLDTYHTEEESGQIARRQLQVLGALKVLGGATNLELSNHLCLPINQVTPRTNELVKQGLVKAVGEKVCGVTKRRVLVWGLVRSVIPEEEVSTYDRKIYP